MDAKVTDENNYTDHTDEYIAAMLLQALAKDDGPDLQSNNHGQATYSSLSMTATGVGSDENATSVPSATAAPDSMMAHVYDASELYPISPPFPVYEDETGGYISEGDETASEDEGFHFNEDGTATENLTRPKKTKRHSPMTAEQQRMTILQIEAQLKVFNADSTSRSFKNAPAHLQKRQTSTSELAGPGNTRRTSDVSKTDSAQSPPPQQGQKRGRPRKNEKRLGTQAGKKAKKEEEMELQPQVQRIVDLMTELGKPSDKRMEEIINYATEALDGQEGTEEAIAALVEMETASMKQHKLHFNAINAILQRYGVIPLGSVPDINS